LHADQRALLYLEKIPLLAVLERAELTNLARQLSLHKLRKRRVLFMTGDAGGSVFFVLSGRIKMSRVTRDGKELTLAYRGPGEIVGELCLVDGGPREEMAETMEASLMAEIPREDFWRLVERHPAMGAQMTRTLCLRRRELERKVEDLVFKDVNAKLSELLLDLGQEYGVDDPRGILVAIKITHQEMANLIGSTRETVSLTLSQFKRNKLITTEGRKIIITDREGLAALM